MDWVEGLTDVLLDLLEKAKVTFHAPPVADQLRREKLIYDFFAPLDRLGPIGSCGITVQPKGESAYDPLAVGDHDQALGLCQWWPGRRAAIKAGCGVDIDALIAAKDNSDGAVLLQCRAMWWELNGTPGEPGPYHAALAAIKAAKAPYDAGYAAEVYFEKSGTPGDPEKRGGFAVDLAKRFGVAA